MHSHHDGINMAGADVIGVTITLLSRSSDGDCAWMLKQLGGLPRIASAQTKRMTKKTIKMLNKLINTRDDFDSTLTKMLDMVNDDYEYIRCVALIGWILAKNFDYTKWFASVEEKKETTDMSDDHYLKSCRIAKQLHILNQFDALECVLYHLEIVEKK